MRVADVTRSCALAMGVRRGRLFSRSKAYNIAHPRQLAMTLCRLYTRKSLPFIGDHFGGFDHTTVLHGMRAVADRCKDPVFARQISIICAIVEIDDTARRMRRLNERPVPVALLPPPPKPPLPPSWSASQTARRIMVAA